MLRKQHGQPRRGGASPGRGAAVRRRMRRDPAEQPYLAHRIAGGAARLPNLEVYSKSGTWGPILADAGIVRHVSGRQMVLVVFTAAQPAYRGDFIADLTYRCAQRLIMPPGLPPRETGYERETGDSPEG